MRPDVIGRRRPIVSLLALAGAVLIWLGACALTGAPSAPLRPIAEDQLKSGLEFSSGTLREQQNDPILNPGMLSVDDGARAWKQRPDNGQRSCESCHGEASRSMLGLAARLPKPSADGRRLDNLHTLVNQCRVDRQKLLPLEYESRPMLSMVSFLANQSRGLPVKVEINGAARPFFEQGQRYYNERIGQINMACTHCHDQNWGRRLLNEPISQGHGNAYPIYRLEWQTVGSLHRRFRSCQFGVRAELLPQGHEQFMALELYLAWRGQGLLVESPGVRR